MICYVDWDGIICLEFYLDGIEFPVYLSGFYGGMDKRWVNRPRLTS